MWMLFRGPLELYSYFSSYFRRYVQYIHLYTFMGIDVIYIYTCYIYIYSYMPNVHCKKLLRGCIDHDLCRYE